MPDKTIRTLQSAFQVMMQFNEQILTPKRYCLKIIFEIILSGCFKFTGVFRFIASFEGMGMVIIFFLR